MHRGTLSSSARVRARLARGDRRREGGQALAEFGLVVAMILFLAMGVFDLGRAFDAQVSVTQAARDGARAGMAPRIVTDGERQTVAAAAANSVRPGASVTVSGCFAETFTVTVSFTLNAITPMMGNFTISESMTSRCRNS
jgi:Flp pilus assembly protein TadG